LDRRKKTFNERMQYCTRDRAPFFKLAEEFLPPNQAEIILDIGSGNGEFVRLLNLDARFPHLYLLDSNPLTVNTLKQQYKNVLQYTIPDKLMFEDETVAFIHSSHVIEHLTSQELYAFLIEINRVLKHKGILILSAPLLWPKFYHDLSHVRPYYPETILRYLVFNASNYSRRKISDQFSVKKMVYRYHKRDFFEEGLGSDYYYIDIFIHTIKHFFRKIGINNYIRNGYTLILEKN
jgi:SAM-dependent methyltransferase